jgi:simple sugar transport system substrate-binding protein
MKRLVVALLIVVLGVLTACGSTTKVREESVDVPAAGGSATGTESATPGAGAMSSDMGGVRLAIVTHGPASSPFWAIVRNGVEAAARQMDVVVNYRAPDIYSLDRMITLIDEAVASRPDGLVVSFPEPGLGPAIRRAVAAGIPTVTINSGSDQALGLGVLAHVGQPERQAGLRAGQRLARAGVRRALCVNQQIGNTGLDDRCRGLAQALRAVGGRSRVLGVDDQSARTPLRIANAVRGGEIDGVLALNSTSGTQAVRALRDMAPSRRPVLGVFDLGPEVLEGVRTSEISFAVDQQAYLQGYLPVVLLTQRARYGLFPEQRDVISTGPNFVTRKNAEKAIELSQRSIR